HDFELADRLPEPGELPQLQLRVACPPPGAAGDEEGAASRSSTAFSSGATSADVAVPFSELERSEPWHEVVRVEEEDPAVILYTSGTTGRPKGAMLTHLSIVHSSLHYIACMGLTHEDRSLLAVPASHVTGLIANIAAFAGAGGAVVLMSAFKAPEFLTLCARERITHTL